jgi:Bacterial Ig-like domain (group 3)
MSVEVGNQAIASAVAHRPGRMCVVAIALLGIALLHFPAPALAMNVTSTGDSGDCSLRTAINAINDNNSGTACGAVLSGQFTPVNLPANTYTPTDGQLQIKSGAKVEIIGASINDPLTTVIDATTNVLPHRVFEVLAGGQLKLIGLQVTGGRTLNAAPSSNYGISAEPGAGILNRGYTTLDHVVLSDNLTGVGGAGGDGGLASDHHGFDAGWGGDGGGIYNLSGASLSITSSTIRDNGTGGGGQGGTGAMGVNGNGQFANGGPGGDGGKPGSGGGIWNQGSVTISNSTLSGNFTGRGGNGGNGGQGAGPKTEGQITFGPGSGGDGGDGGSAGYSKYEYCVCYSTIPGVYGGGGIFNTGGGSMTITNSTISGNNTGAGGNGGGAGVGGPDQNQHSRTGSHGGFAGSGGFGGAIYSAFANTSLTNVTLSGNLTGDGGIGGNGPTTGSLGPGPGGYGGDGGAIWAAGARSGYNVTLTHVTISKNTLGSAGPGGAPGAPPEGNPVSNGTPGIRGIGSGVATGGRYDTYGSSVQLKNTIIANNGLVSDSNCVDSGAAPSNFADLGGNVTWGGTTCPGTSADPMLGLLQDNGGPTLTMLPASGSAAIGAITSGCNSVATDQRGYPRPGTGKSACDAGAAETGPPPGVTATTIALSSSANPSTAGQPVTFTATVSPPPSSGTFSFTDGGSVIPSCEAAALEPSGKATCKTSFAAAGSHPIVVSYTGNSLFSASSSSTLTQVVQSQSGGGGGPGGGGTGGGGSTPPPIATAPVAPKVLKCPKSKKRVVVKGKAKCVKRKRRHKGNR